MPSEVERLDVHAVERNLAGELLVPRAVGAPSGEHKHPHERPASRPATEATCGAVAGFNRLGLGRNESEGHRRQSWSLFGVRALSARRFRRSNDVVVEQRHVS
jgi:hypothetical protein